MLAHLRKFSCSQSLCKQIVWGSHEYKQMLELRDMLLRKPLGLSIYDDDLDREKNVKLYGAFRNDKVIACAYLDPKTATSAQLKQMAVTPSLQKQHIGSTLLKYIEGKAREPGLDKIVLHARQVAFPFYEKNRYEYASDLAIITQMISDM